jgi:hypothetical protein
VAQCPAPAPAPEYALKVTEQTAPISLDPPFRCAAAIPLTKQPAIDGRTPLTSMFRALGGTSPSREDRTRTTPGLQNLLSLL